MLSESQSIPIHFNSQSNKIYDKLYCTFKITKRSRIVGQASLLLITRNLYSGIVSLPVDSVPLLLLDEFDSSFDDEEETERRRAVEQSDLLIELIVSLESTGSSLELATSGTLIAAHLLCITEVVYHVLRID